jgi:hypothetical protein
MFQCSEGGEISFYNKNAKIRENKNPHSHLVSKNKTIRKLKESETQTVSEITENSTQTNFNEILKLENVNYDPEKLEVFLKNVC